MTQTKVSWFEPCKISRFNSPGLPGANFANFDLTCWACRLPELVELLSESWWLCVLKTCECFSLSPLMSITKSTRLHRHLPVPVTVDHKLSTIFGKRNELSCTAGNGCFCWTNLLANNSRGIALHVIWDYWLRSVDWKGKRLTQAIING